MKSRPEVEAGCGCLVVQAERVWKRPHNGQLCCLGSSPISIIPNKKCYVVLTFPAEVFLIERLQGFAVDVLYSVVAVSQLVCYCRKRAAFYVAAI